MGRLPPQAVIGKLRRKLAAEVLVAELRLRPPQVVARLRRLQLRRLQMRCRLVRVVAVGVLVERRLQPAAAGVRLRSAEKVVATVTRFRRRQLVGRRPRPLGAEERLRPPRVVGRLRLLSLRRRLLVRLRLVRMLVVEVLVGRRLQPPDAEARLRPLRVAVRLRRH